MNKKKWTLSFTVTIFTSYRVKSNILYVCLTWFLGYGGHPRGQRVGVDPSLSHLLPLAHSSIKTAPAICHCHYRQAVHRHVLRIYTWKKITHQSKIVKCKGWDTNPIWKWSWLGLLSELSWENMLLYLTKKLSEAFMDCFYTFDFSNRNKRGYFDLPGKQMSPNGITTT